MGWNSSEQWHGQWHERRRHGNFWIVPLVIFGLIILTHGWILFLPLMALAAFAFFGFVLPRVMWHMHEGEWHGGDWSQWANEKRKRHFGDWHHWDNGPHARYDEKPKRDNADDIEYV
jgi:hypothetical protein